MKISIKKKERSVIEALTNIRLILRLVLSDSYLQLLEVFKSFNNRLRNGGDLVIKK